MYHLQFKSQYKDNYWIDSGFDGNKIGYKTVDAVIHAVAMNHFNISSAYEYRIQFIPVPEPLIERTLQ